MSYTQNFRHKISESNDGRNLERFTPNLLGTRAFQTCTCTSWWYSSIWGTNLDPISASLRTVGVSAPYTGGVSGEMEDGSLGYSTCT